MKLTKKKRLEKAKVKLRAKKLPKGQNVTDTSFKARKIVLPSQLKDTKPGDIITKKQHNIPNLISHLDHHRVQMRNLGLQGLKEIIQSYDAIELALYLPKIFESIASRILDLESGIRKTSLDILKILIAKTPSEILAPHFQSLQVYMNAAMTHINPHIQKDSLCMLDLLLNEAPELMKKNVNTFLPTFLDLVSNAKNNSTSERTLFDVFNKKVSNVKWRDMVLSRLTKYFSLLVSLKRTESVKSWSAAAFQDRSKTSAVIHWNGDKPLYIGEQLLFPQRICYLANIFTISPNVIDTKSSDEEYMMKHTESMMPILLDSWAEVAPKSKDQKGNLVDYQAAITLQFILETIVSVWKTLEDLQKCSGKIIGLTTWFKEKYKKKIVRKFISHFPFECDDVFAHTQNNKFTEGEKLLLLNPLGVSQKCIEQNLLICYLIECLDCASDTDISGSVVECLNTCLNNWGSNKSLPTLIMVLKALLNSDKRDWRTEIVGTVIVAGLKIKSLTEDLRFLLLEYFCDYMLLTDSAATAGGKELDKFLSELPLLLLQPKISMKMILLLRSVSSQNRELFMMTLKKQCRSICENLFVLQITGVDSQVEGQKAIMDILFYTKNVDLYKFTRQLAIIKGNEELISYIENMEEFYLHLHKSL